MAAKTGFRRPAVALGVVVVAFAMWAQTSTVQRMKTEMTRLLQAAAGAQSWQLVGEPRFFLGEEIYTYMNGAGEIPRACGFRLLAVGDYRQAGGSGARLELYDMGSSANAFGLYSMKRDPSQQVIRQTAHPGSLARGQLILWKDRFTAILIADDARRLPANALVELGTALDKSITSAGKPPGLVGLLPSAGRIDRTEKYFHNKFALDTIWFRNDNLLRLDDRTEVACAQYRDPSARLLLVRYPSPQTVPRVLAVASKELGAGQRASLPSGFTGFTGAQKGKGIGLLGRKQYLGLVWDAPDAATAGRKLQDLARALQSAK